MPRATRSNDPFFVVDQQQNDGERDVRKEREDDESSDDVSHSTAQRAAHKPHNKRPRSQHAHTDSNVHSSEPAFATAPTSSSSSSSSSQSAPPPKRRKDAPLEMSSKHPTPLPSLSSAQLLPPRSFQPRDPRFDALLPATSYSSHFNAKGAYKFLDELQEHEIAAMKKLQRTVKAQHRKEEIKAELQSKLSARKESERKERETSALRQWRKQEMAARRDGKKPFYLKERDKKAVKLVSEYSRLKERGQEGAIVRKVEKKRKQRAQHDQKSMPRQAAVGGQ